MRNAKSTGIAIGALLLASAAQAASLHLVRSPVEATLPARAAVLLPRLSPAARLVIAREAAREVSARQISFARAREAVLASHVASTSGDIEALVEAIMMQCAADADAELRDEIANMQKVLKQKSALRGEVSQMKAAQQNANAGVHNRYAAALQQGQSIVPRFTLDDYAAGRPLSYQQSLDQMQDDLDDLNGMGEIEQMKLQELSDARSKAFEMLSNMMKSTADTQRKIIGNMK